MDPDQPDAPTTESSPEAPAAAKGSPSEASSALLSGALTNLPTGAEALRLRLTAHEAGALTNKLAVVALLHPGGPADLAAEHQEGDSAETWGFPLDSDEVEELREGIRPETLWSRDGSDGPRGDGEMWEIEHATSTESRRVTRWNPEADDEFLALGNLLLDLAGVLGDELEGSIFDRHSPACHGALEQLRDVLMAVGFKVDKKHPNEATLRVYLPEREYPLLNPRFHPYGQEFGAPFAESLVTSVWYRDGAEAELESRLRRFPDAPDVVLRAPHEDTVNRGIRHLGWFVVPLTARGEDPGEPDLEALASPLERVRQFLLGVDEEDPRRVFTDA